MEQSVLKNHNSQIIIMKKLYTWFFITKWVYSIFQVLIWIWLLIGWVEKTKNFLNYIASVELSEDKNDFIANWIIQFSHNFSIQLEHFLAFYLIVEGIIKILMVYGLLKEKLYIYPIAFLFFTTLLLYELYTLLLWWSLFLLIVFWLDVILLIIIYKEYKKLLERKS